MVVSFCTRSLLLSRRKLFEIAARQHGYTVLLPQIGEDLVKRNPLVKPDNTPEFNNATIEKCIAAILKQSIEVEETIKELEAALQKNTDLHLFRDVIDPLEKTDIPLQLTVGIAQALYFGNHGLLPTKTYQKLFTQAKSALGLKYNNPFIYNACLKAKEQKDPTRTPEEERVIDKYLLENRLNGAGLSGRSKEKYEYYQKFLQKHTQEFLDKVLHMKKNYSLKIDDPKIVESFPEDLLLRTCSNPEQCRVGPWKITLNSPVFEQFLEYCPDPLLRANIWNVSASRGSQQGDRSFRTSVAVEEIRVSKQDIAHALGFPTYVEFSMQTKMAGSKKNILDTFDVLLEKAYPAQQREIASLTKFRGMSDEWKECDLPFYIRKQREHLFPYDRKNLHHYFPFGKVLTGLFQFLEHMYDIKIVESRKADVWHKEVRYFEIFEGSNLDEPISGFYLDPYDPIDTRIHVQAHGANTVIISKKSKIGKTKPIIALIFKFRKPTKEKPCLMTFTDVSILFQQFGYVMSCLLNRGERGEVSGHSYLEWDTAYIGNHFMQNWLYEPSVIKQISSHYDTNKPISEETILALKSERAHFKGYQMCKEMYWSHLDLELFSKEHFWPKLTKGLWSKYFVIPHLQQDERLLSSIDIIHQSSAAYFSRLWSEMLAADVYSAFKEVPIQNTDKRKEIAKRYRDTFLASSGSCATSEIFRRFRGRDPSPKALLKTLEIDDSTPDCTT